MEKAKTVRCHFEFYFYNKYAIDFKRFFKKKSRVTIWSEEDEQIGFAGEFEDFEEKDGKIFGTMILLLREGRDLYQIKNRKYYLNHPEDIAGHIILQNGKEELLD